MGIKDYCNSYRPHQPHNMQVPGGLYANSPGPHKGLGDLDYPIHDWTATITSYGRICYKCRKINLSSEFAGQKVSIKNVLPMSPVWASGKWRPQGALDAALAP